MKSALTLLLLAVPLCCTAQSAPPPETVPEPLVQHRVTQDQAVRIDELQVRGATQSITVQPLHGGPSYRVNPPAPGQDPTTMAGRMQWTLGTFN